MTNKLVSKRELEISLTMRPTWELKDLFNLIDRMPLVDGGFTRHRHWDEEMGGYVCSECEGYSDFATNYCPYCGAKMDEVVDVQESD